MDNYRFVIARPAEVEETRYCEFKEIKGGRPLDTIKNTCDEYVVAFLNSSGGHSFHVPLRCRARSSKSRVDASRYENPLVMVEIWSYGVLIIHFPTLAQP